ncbi:MAG: flagellar motor switch protein FliM [Alphaproteobacteria bacterium]
METLDIPETEVPAPVKEATAKSSEKLNPQDTKDVLMGMLNKTDVNYERLPMLEVVFDRLVRLMSTSLRNFTSDNVEVHLESISSIRFGDYLDDLTETSMIGVFKAEEWDNYGLFTVSSSMIYSVVDVLLGGRRGAPMSMEGRPYTTIERSLVEKMLILVLNDLSVSFDPLSPVTFRFDRLETNARFAVIVRPANISILARFRVEMEERGGAIELLLPYATLEPIREVLLQMFMGEKFGRDSIWEGHLATQLTQTDVVLEAVLEESEMLLTDVLKWDIGSRVILDAAPDTPVTLKCNDVPMFTGGMGQKAGNIAISIDQKLGKQTV